MFCSEKNDISCDFFVDLFQRFREITTSFIQAKCKQEQKGGEVRDESP